MSAWMTSEKHINTLATFAYVEGLTLDPATLATSLTLHNVLSLRARYPSGHAAMTTGWREYTYKPVNLTKTSPTFVLKQARCFDYQACEHDGWRDSETKRLLDLIMERCTAQGAVEKGPRYEAAPWGIE